MADEDKKVVSPIFSISLPSIYWPSPLIPFFQDPETEEEEDDDFCMDGFGSVEEAIAKYENINLPDVKRGMFVSGWDDPNDSVDEDADPEGNLII